MSATWLGFVAVTRRTYVPPFVTWKRFVACANRAVSPGSLEPIASVAPPWGATST